MAAPSVYPRPVWKIWSERILETPISENSFTGMAVGAAMLGLRPVVEIMFMDFLALATAVEQCRSCIICTTDRSKCQWYYAPGGAKGGYARPFADAQQPAGWNPGLKVVAPRRRDRQGMLKAAIRDDNRSSLSKINASILRKVPCPMKNICCHWTRLR